MEMNVSLIANGMLIGGIFKKSGQMAAFILYSIGYNFICFHLNYIRQDII